MSINIVSEVEEDFTCFMRKYPKTCVQIVVFVCSFVSPFLLSKESCNDFFFCSFDGNVARLSTCDTSLRKERRPNAFLESGTIYMYSQAPCTL